MAWGTPPNETVPCRFQWSLSNPSAIDVQFADSGWAGRHLAGPARLARSKNGQLWIVASRHCGGAFQEPDLTHRRSTKPVKLKDTFCDIYTNHEIVHCRSSGCYQDGLITLQVRDRPYHFQNDDQRRRYSMHFVQRI
jgi:hypothetical protein